MKIGTSAAVAAAAATLGVAVTTLAGGGTAPSRASTTAATRVSAPPPRHFTARRMRPRPGALRPGTVVGRSALFGDRVFSNARDGFALANGISAQYPAVSKDGGHSWRIAGPQFHIDAADGPEGVGFVGLATPHTMFAYGSSVVDVSSDGGRSWWETFLGELVSAVAQDESGHLVAYVESQRSNTKANPADTWQYVSRDGGRHWSYTTALTP